MTSDTWWMTKMASYYKELTDVSDIVRFRKAGLCYIKDTWNRRAKWQLLRGSATVEQIARFLADGWVYAILVDEDE